MGKYCQVFYSSQIPLKFDCIRAVAKPARHLVMQMQILTLSLFISLEIDSLYGLQTQKKLHLHDQLSGWLRHCVRDSRLNYCIFLLISAIKADCLNGWSGGRRENGGMKNFFTPPFCLKTKFQLPRH